MGQTFLSLNDTVLISLQGNEMLGVSLSARNQSENKPKKGESECECGSESESESECVGECVGVVCMCALLQSPIPSPIPSQNQAMLHTRREPPLLGDDARMDGAAGAAGRRDE